jgi:hypothetical protein
VIRSDNGNLYVADGDGTYDEANDDVLQDVFVMDADGGNVLQLTQRRKVPGARLVARRGEGSVSRARLRTQRSRPLGNGCRRWAADPASPKREVGGLRHRLGRLVQPARLEPALLDSQSRCELGIAKDLLDEALGVLAADERLDGVTGQRPGAKTDRALDAAERLDIATFASGSPVGPAAAESGRRPGREIHVGRGVWQTVAA